MSKFRKHSIEEKRRRSKVRKQKKKLARKYSEICSADPEITARELLDAMQNQSIENGRRIGQDDDDNSREQQPPH